jgi:hypothetical protein
MTDNAEIHQEKSDVKNKHIYHHLTWNHKINIRKTSGQTFIKSMYSVCSSYTAVG